MTDPLRPVRNTGSGPAAGFTLLEVLLAVGLLVVSLTVFLRAASQALVFIHEAQTYAQARTYLHQLDLQVPLDLENLEEGKEQGHLETAGPERVLWSRTFTPVGKEEDRFFRIRTEVSWGDGLQESLTTYLHLPSALEGGWVQEPADGSVPGTSGTRD